MKYLSHRIKNIPPSGIRKFFELIQSTPDIISLGVGEPDFITPWHIREVCMYSIEKGFTTYTSNLGMIELRQEISKYLKKEYNIYYNPEKEILITVGVSEALDLALRAIINESDEVIIHEPCYVSYVPCVIFAGGKPVIIPTVEEENFELNPDKLEEKITNRTKAILLSYPNNPTGAVLSKDKLLRIAEIVEKYDLLVISDEIYHKLTYDNHTHICFSSLKGMKNRTILLNGFSKTYAMTGLRIGFAAAAQNIIEGMVKIHQYTMLCAPTPSQVAAIEALKNGHNDVEYMKEEYDKRRKLLFSELNRIGLNCTEPKGAFYIFPSIKKTNLSSDKFAEELLKQEKVAVVSGSAFGESGEGYIRISYAASIKNIEEALKKINRFLKRL